MCIQFAEWAKKTDYFETFEDPYAPVWKAA